MSNDIKYIVCFTGMFAVVAVVFSRLGHFSTDNDPVFDPLNNPNVRVAHENHHIESGV